MTHLKNDKFGIDGSFKKLDTTPKGQERSVMAVEAVVEGKPQLLKKLRPFFTACRQIPQTLPQESIIVLAALFSCFEKAGNVQEGQVKDISWGFEQIVPPIPEKLTMTGIRQLAERGYIRLEGLDNAPMSTDATNIAEAWLRYTSKTLDLVYE